MNCIDLKGNTPLHLSAQRGFVHLARELLKWGAQPNILDSKGHTPMEIAIHLALGGAEEVVEIYNLYAVFIIKEMEPSRLELAVSTQEYCPFLCLYIFFQVVRT